MHGHQLPDWLQLHHDALLDQQIYPIADIYHKAVIHNRDRNLRLHLNSTLCELVCQTDPVCALEHARPEYRVHPKRRGDNLACDQFVLHRARISKQRHRRVTCDTA